MREIKFRAWDKVGEVMVYQDRITIAENGNWILMSKPGSDFEGRGIPLMQYTGLRDKNGKEIYEGDIIEWSVYEDAQDTASGEEEKSRWKDSVYFSNGCFALEKRKELLFNFLAPHKELEIIGNIYENPELLTL